VVEIAPEGTVTEAGTMSAVPGLAAMVTGVPVSAADLEIVTIQVVAADAATLVEPHCREERTATPTTFIVSVWTDVLSFAARIAVWSVVVAAAVTENVAVLKPALMWTDAGGVRTVGAVLVRVIVEPPPSGAAAASVTVQVVTEDAAGTVVAHDSLLIAG
jgi:hypothetical protein